MSQTKQLLAILGAIGAAYVWLTIPALSYYSLQIFAVATFSYFILRKISVQKKDSAQTSHSWNILPTEFASEIALLSFAITLLIGATGNTTSVFYPFVYVHLFLIVMATKELTAVGATIAILMVHYALEGQLHTPVFASFLTLPLLLIFFTFAKKQYEQTQLQQNLLSAKTVKMDHITRKELTLEGFLSRFLEPKLAILQDILKTAIKTEKPIKPHILLNQIEMIASESEKILSKTKKNDSDQNDVSEKTDYYETN